MDFDWLEDQAKAKLLEQIEEHERRLAVLQKVIAALKEMREPKSVTKRIYTALCQTLGKSGYDNNEWCEDYYTYRVSWNVDAFVGHRIHVYEIGPDYNMKGPIYTISFKDGWSSMLVRWEDAIKGREKSLEELRQVLLDFNTYYATVEKLHAVIKEFYDTPNDFRYLFQIPNSSHVLDDVRYWLSK